METIHTQAGSGPHQLMLGSVTVSRLLGGDDLSLVELKGLPGSGPGIHVDPWAESFYVLEGELTFKVDEGSGERSIVAGPGDALSIAQGIRHGFSVSSSSPARYLIASTPGGIDAFFADAGEPIDTAELPETQQPFDRERLLAAFAKYDLN